MKFSIMLLALLALTMLVSAAPPSALKTKSTSPSFCQGFNCPTYSLLNIDIDLNVEIRAYSESLWVRTAVSGVSLDVALVIGGQRLIAFFSGANSLGIAIDFALPFTVEISANGYIVSCYLPFVYQSCISANGTIAGNVPVPTDNHCYVEVLPACNFAVQILTTGLIGQILQIVNNLLAGILHIVANLIGFVETLGFIVVRDVQILAFYGNPLSQLLGGNSGLLGGLLGSNGLLGSLLGNNGLLGGLLGSNGLVGGLLGSNGLLGGLLGNHGLLGALLGGILGGGQQEIWLPIH